MAERGTPTSTRCTTTSHTPTINRSNRQPGSRAGGQRCAHSRTDRNGGTRYQQSRTQREARAVQFGRPRFVPRRGGRMSHPLSATSALAHAQVLSHAYIFENKRNLAFEISDIFALNLLKRKQLDSAISIKDLFLKTSFNAFYLQFCCNFASLNHLFRPIYLPLTFETLRLPTPNICFLERDVRIQASSSDAGSPTGGARGGARDPHKEGKPQWT